MSLGFVSFVIVMIVAISFCIEYSETAKKNKIIILFLILFSLYCLIYGIYIFSSWDDYVSQRSVDWLSKNPGAKNVPTTFLIIPIYPYVLIFFGIAGLLFYSKYLKSKK